MILSIGVLISGGGSNLQALIERMEAGVLNVRIRTVISNNPKAKGLERAKRHGIPALVLPHADYPDRRGYDQALVQSLEQAEVEAVILAGFMRLVGPDLLAAFPQRVLNIHPALLPAFPGLHAQAKAAAYGVRLSGCTVHFVDEQVDHGPIIIQAAVPALFEDDAQSLGARILRLEHRIYPQAVQWLAEGRLEVLGRQVKLLPCGRLQAGRPLADPATLPPCLVHPMLEEGF
jgi:phosphoribosylglycinamide formyltransferase-1